MLNRDQIDRAAGRGSLEAQPVEDEVEVPEQYIDLIRTEDNRMEEARLGGSKIHVSSVIGDFCPRKHWLATRSGRTTHTGVGGAMRVVWAIGRTVEHHVRQQLLASPLGKYAFGRWYCGCGLWDDEPSLRPPEDCGECNQGYNYGEALLEHGPLTGSPDFIFLIDGRLVVFEIKSIKKDGFEALMAPEPAHCRQARFYSWLLTKKGYQVDPTIRVIYVAKDYLRGGIYKEYPFEMTASGESSCEMHYQEAVTAVAKECPPRLATCQSCESVKARTCPFVGECFIL